jgi:hypothetical protein
MSRLIQFILIAVSLMVLAPAQAVLNIDVGSGACQVFAADDSDKKEGEEEEEEPDCD